MSETVHVSYHLNCSILDKVLWKRSVLLSFQRCRNFGCRFLAEREVSFQVAATNKLVSPFDLMFFGDNCNHSVKLNIPVQEKHQIKLGNTTK